MQSFGLMLTKSNIRRKKTNTSRQTTTTMKLSLHPSFSSVVVAAAMMVVMTKTTTTTNVVNAQTVACSDDSYSDIQVCFAPTGQGCPNGFTGGFQLNNVALCYQSITGSSDPSIGNIVSGATIDTTTICGVNGNDIPTCESSSTNGGGDATVDNETAPTEAPVGMESSGEFQCPDVGVSDTLSCNNWCDLVADKSDFGSYSIFDGRCECVLFEPPPVVLAECTGGPTQVLGDTPAPVPAPPAPPAGTSCDTVSSFGEINNGGECSDACRYFGLGGIQQWQYQSSFSSSGGSSTSTLTRGCTCSEGTQICFSVTTDSSTANSFKSSSIMLGMATATVALAAFGLN